MPAAFLVHGHSPHAPAFLLFPAPVPPLPLQGLYKKIRFDQLEVSTFCFHGGPNGRLSGITGSVTCADPAALELLPEFKTDLEARLRIRVKCVLRFPAVPFVPPEPYNVIRTDYETFALVQGARDFSFVQVYSRTPNPGPEFIAARLKVGAWAAAWDDARRPSRGNVALACV